MSRDYKLFRPYMQMYAGDALRFVCLFGYGVDFIRYREQGLQSGRILFESIAGDEEAHEFVQLSAYGDGAMGGAFVGIHPFDLLQRGWTLDKADEFLRRKLDEWGFDVPAKLEPACAEYVFEA